MSLFVDTSALFALLVRSELRHTAVARAFRVAAERARALSTTNYVVVETVALLQHRVGLDGVRDLETRIIPLLTVHFVEPELHRRAVARLFRIDRRTVSLVDAASFTVMEDQGISEVLGLDSDFAAEGFRLVP